MIFKGAPRTSLVIFSLLILVVQSCSSVTAPSNEVDGTYKLYDIVPGNGISFDSLAILNSKLGEGEIISIFNDKTFVWINAVENYYNGKWKLEDDDRLLLTPADTALGILSVKTFPENDQKTRPASLELQKDGMVFKFLKVSIAPGKPEEDPFHWSNNLWREKAGKMEDSLQIKKRVANYVKHTALVLKASFDRNEDVVSIEYSEGPIQIFLSGIGIIPFEKVADSWKKNFYNEEQAMTGYKIYGAAVRSAKYSGAKTDSWVMDDYKILLSIYAQIIR